MINILGEVNAAGYYKFDEGMRVSDALRNAGGLSNDADDSNIFVSFPNGKSIKYHRIWNNTKIQDGSTITVGIKPEEEPFDKTEYLKEMTTIIANFAQVISIVLIASR